jgi:hypothetical protein
LNAVSKPDGACHRRALGDDRLEQRRLSGAVRTDERHVLAALERERRLAEKRPVSRRNQEVLGLDDRPPAARGLQELEAKGPARARVTLELVGSLGTLLLQAGDVRELRLGLFRLRLLVAEALHEPLEPRDVVGGPLRDPRGRLRPRGLLPAPGVPRPGEEQ